MGLLLTKSTTPVIGQVAYVLGYLMEGIFWVLDKIGIPNIGLSIIIFTIVIYLLMSPLTIKQQKFSKLSAKMNPELQAINAKYKGKKDSESMAAMQQETGAVYAKYGVSPTGSCLQLVIQMPILFALYRVIYNMPAYVGKIKEAYSVLVDKLYVTDGSFDLLQSFSTASAYKKQFTNEQFTTSIEYAKNTIIDVLNKASSTDWASISSTFPDLAANVDQTLATLERYNNFLGLNIANSPSFMVKEAWAAGNYLMIAGALVLPLLSVITQWLNVKLMPQAAAPATDNEQANSMANSMKTMNKIMPLMSAYFCFILPAGMGLYWVAGALVRSVIQIVINKHIDKMDIEEIIVKNNDKYKKKLEKQGITSNKLSSYAKMNTKNVISSSNESNDNKKVNDTKQNKVNTTNTSGNSLSDKANMVKKFNENNRKSE